MAHLKLTGLSEDGKTLLLADDHGAEHRLDVTAGLRTALARAIGGATPARRKEKGMESALRPRDIQARIRAGESTETVAAAAKVSVEAIMAFAGPVLAERAHIAQRAQRGSLRRRPGDTAEAVAGSRLLGEAVESHLRAVNVDPTTVEWDAWRREDGRWSLVAGYTTGARAGLAEFTFDAPGNYALLDNEDARWLVGDPVTEAPAAASLDFVGPTDPAAGPRRLSAVPQQARDRLEDHGAGDPDQLSLGDDVLELLAEPGPMPDPASEPAADSRAEAALQPGTEPETEAEPAPEEPPARRPVQKKKGRASVPSWDEIMFGGGDQ